VPHQKHRGTDGVSRRAFPKASAEQAKRSIPGDFLAPRTQACTPARHRLQERRLFGRTKTEAIGATPIRSLDGPCPEMALAGATFHEQGELT
jgi:hypothetical protein